jgi:glycosyltransferase involved in cell wall biosynthesis
MRVSIVIPALNAASFISDAIDSCLAQTAGTFAFDLEILVVDNGSTDGTADLVRRRYGAKVVLLAEPEPGIAHARNTGIAQVTG